MDRRTLLLAGSAAVTGLVARGAAAQTPVPALGYGPLEPTDSENTGETVLALPKGFRYNVLGRQGTILSDGNPTPIKHDGMAAFFVEGTVRLVRNHEVADTLPRDGAAVAAGPNVYDPLAGGGVTSLTIDPRTRTVIDGSITLAGTHTNCAGGPTPWGSWLSCEETTLGAALVKDDKGKPAGGFSREHGYVFEVPASRRDVVAPVPLTALGRFVHEAIAVDPGTGILYETEDRLSAGFYRFVPKVPGRLIEGGRLQMLCVEDRPRYDTRKRQKVGRTLPCVWTDIEDPDPADASHNPLSVYQAGHARGGATFARLEGCWWGNGSVYLNSTNGGDRGLGQVWRYRPTGDRGELTLLYESRDSGYLWNPDNLCVTPRGGLLLCEDTYGGDCFLRGLTRSGRLFDFAHNIYSGYEISEFAGACFSPDAQTLFVNLQEPGVTLAIWGPWHRGPL